ncbi:MAG: glycoside hydrolase family 3 C-terminal domain-containing protein [Oscillospiraceae bacterium]|jgi:beta-glucosidase|nr:glycoside hydrolase family 3 C-terminal domain-containing protein [Oscillospiraceae bacterium]
MTDNARKTYADAAAALAAQMTLEEKMAQLLHTAPEIPHLGVPAYNYWNEALHGVARAGTATVFPQAIALAAAFDPELLREVADAIATEGRAKYNAASARGDRGIYKGLTFYSPNINIFRDPRWGRGHETYGEDPYLTARLGVAFIQGLQGEGETLKAAACAKHFAVHSGPEAKRHVFNAEVSARDLWETYLPAFEAAVREAGAEMVMGAYNAAFGKPCCASELLLLEILREKWGFDGHVVSDFLAVRDFHENHKYTATAKESAAAALNAGCNLNLGYTYEQLPDALADGLVTEEEIDGALVRVLATRYRLGILGAGSEYDAVRFEENDSPAHAALNLRAALESAVLLKNSGVLPLDTAKYRRVAVIGPNADSRLALKGNYYGVASQNVTVLDGVRAIAGQDCEIRYAAGAQLSRDRSDMLAAPRDELAEAAAAAEWADVTILVLGLDETLEGEEGGFGDYYFSGDKTDLLLPASQRELLEAMCALETPVILCLMAGSALDLRYADARCAAILDVWYPGALGGLAAAKLIFGEASPCGKLPVTFYRSVEDLPDFEDYAMSGRTYRYIGTEPLYPFGFGLTYGDTLAEHIEYVSGDRENGASLRVRVTNRGAAAVKDVLQIYVKPDASEFAPPNPILAAFAKVSLAPGETKTADISVPPEAFTVVDDDGARVSGGESFRLFAGFGQPDSRTLGLTGHPCASLTVTL